MAEATEEVRVKPVEASLGRKTRPWIPVFFFKRMLQGQVKHYNKDLHNLIYVYIYIYDIYIYDIYIYTHT